MKTTPLFFGFFLFIAVVTNAQFSGGTGTTEDPFQIATKADLDTLSHNPSYWDKHFIQTADIVFHSSDFQSGGAFYNGGAGFSPIGNSKNGFTGSYNGQDHVIDSLYINRPKQDYVGFFGYISSTAIDRLGVSNVNITGLNIVGGLCGWSEKCTIRHCYTTGNVSGNYQIGGFCGWNYKGTIRNNYYKGSVSGKNNTIGGFCGVNQGSINNSYITGNVFGKGWIGGFCGENNKTIRKCYATGNVSGKKDNIGGFCGRNFLGTIRNCYATGSVSGTNNIGGFCGLTKEGTHYTCFSIGSVLGKGENIGGFCGLRYFEIIFNCFWDTQTSGLTNSSGGIGKITAEMKDQSTFTDAAWDFTGVWQMSLCINKGYRDCSKNCVIFNLSLSH